MGSLAGSLGAATAACAPSHSTRPGRLVALHAQTPAMPLFGATHLTGRMVVTLCDPSHQGSFLVRPQAHQK